MSEHHENVNPFDPLSEPLLEHWIGYVQQVNETTRRMLSSADKSEDPRTWRRQWFEALGQDTDAYLRTPVFLRTLKAHLDTLLQAKREADPSAHDLDELARRLANVEQARARLEQLERRLESLEIEPPKMRESKIWERFFREPPKPPATVMMGTTQHDVVHAEGTLRLLRYRNRSVRHAEPILICYALVNRPYILDLQADRSVVRQLLDRGFDVYMIDWGVPTRDDRALRLHDYVCRFLRHVVDFVCDHAGTQQLNLLGYCMGGTMSTMFTALYPRRVRSLTLLATPIDFGGDDGLLNLWAHEDHFDVDQLIDTYGNCPGEFLQYCFQLMKPVQNFAEKYVTFFENQDDGAFLHSFFAMERWVNDCIPVAGETFRDYVKMLYQRNLLVNGDLLLDGVSVKLSDITCPLLLLVADQDHLVPPDSSLALARHVRSKKVKSLSINAGHIGLAVSSKAHRQLWPKAADWIAQPVTDPAN
jgi:polyhydroxyalkanoate synthase